MSKQTEREKIRKDNGLCKNCDNQLNLYTYLCDDCMTIHRERVRLRNGYNKWKAGGVGRPPRGLDYHKY